MKKIWYIKIDEKIEGPFSVRELKRDRRVTPDTLVWRSGFATWVAIGRVVELKSVFAEDDEEPQKQEPTIPSAVVSPALDEVALNLPAQPPIILFLLIIILVVALYIIYRLNVA